MGEDYLKTAKLKGVKYSNYRKQVRISTNIINY